MGVCLAHTRITTAIHHQSKYESVVCAYTVHNVNNIYIYTHILSILIAIKRCRNLENNNSSKNNQHIEWCFSKNKTCMPNILIFCNKCKYSIYFIRSQNHYNRKVSIIQGGGTGIICTLSFIFTFIYAIHFALMKFQTA